MYVHVYQYMYTCTDIAHVNTHTYLHAHTHTYIHTRIPTYIHLPHTITSLHTPSPCTISTTPPRNPLQLCLRVIANHISKHVHTRARTHSHKHVHTYTHILSHAHTHTRPWCRLRRCCFSYVRHWSWNGINTRTWTHIHTHSHTHTHILTLTHDLFDVDCDDVVSYSWDTDREME